MIKLHQVTDEEELVSLREKMERYLPYSSNIHGVLDVMLKTNVGGGIVTKIFIPEEPKSSSFVIVTPSCSEEAMQSVYVFWNTETEDDEVILRLLKSLPNWNWSAPVFFQANPISVSNKIQEYVRKGHFGETWTQKTREGYMYYLEKADLNFDLPEGFSMKCLLPKDIPAVMAPWQSIWTETLLTRLPSVAIQDDTHHRLVSWSLVYKNGFLAMTFTLPEYRRRGFASAVTLAMAQKMRRMGLPVRLVVEAGNEASCKFHEKLGFRRQCDLEAFMMLPEGTTVETWVKQNKTLFGVLTGD